MSLINKLVVITGGSSVIGYQIGKKFQCAGCRVVFISRTRGCIEMRPNNSWMHCDVTNYDTCSSVFQSIQRDHGAVSILINAAGVSSNQLFLRLKVDELQHLIDVNVVGALNTTRAALRQGRMMHPSSGDASVVFIGSIVGETGNEGQVGYAATKAALRGAMLSLVKEHSHPHGVRFNLVNPGLIADSGMAKKLVTNDAAEKFKARCALNRLGTPDDVAEAVLAISSCKYINGQEIAVDGGIK